MLLNFILEFMPTPGSYQFFSWEFPKFHTFHTSLRITISQWKYPRTEPREGGLTHWALAQDTRMTAPSPMDASGSWFISIQLLSPSRWSRWLLQIRQHVMLKSSTFRGMCTKWKSKK